MACVFGWKRGVGVSGGGRSGSDGGSGGSGSDGGSNGAGRSLVDRYFHAPHSQAMLHDRLCVTSEPVYCLRISRKNNTDISVRLMRES